MSQSALRNVISTAQTIFDVPVSGAVSKYELTPANCADFEANKSRFNGARFTASAQRSVIATFRKFDRA